MHNTEITLENRLRECRTSDLSSKFVGFGSVWIQAFNVMHVMHWLTNFKSVFSYDAQTIVICNESHRRRHMLNRARDVNEMQKKEF